MEMFVEHTLKQEVRFKICKTFVWFLLKSTCSLLHAFKGILLIVFSASYFHVVLAYYIFMTLGGSGRHFFYNSSCCLLYLDPLNCKDWREVSTIIVIYFPLLPSSHGVLSSKINSCFLVIPLINLLASIKALENETNHYWKKKYQNILFVSKANIWL